MQYLELLAPARNTDIGIAAIDCGADAVYIAGPGYGARKDAGNDMAEVARLCGYAARFGVRIFLTVNTTIRDEELEEVHSKMLEAQDAGVSAFIIRDPRIAGWDDITIPLHASTQCAIRTLEKARYYESIGCSRIILERELPLETVREICAGTECEVEFFVHGALCVCYSGECRLSEYIDGRSADRGECIQACRSLYDLVDADGKVLVRNKALLSLKDYNLKDRLEDLAEAGVCSFKIEGRLKNASYVKNVVRDYDLALNRIVGKYPDRYCRASCGHVSKGFTPDCAKTFNRGYTQLFIDGKRGRWASMDAPKSMGEPVGTIASVRSTENGRMEVSVKPLRKGETFRNGDGFAVVAKNAVSGFRADVCEGNTLICRSQPELRKGQVLYRNVSTAFEKELETNMCRREISVNLGVKVEGLFKITVSAATEDGRTVESVFNCDDEKALNRERALAMLGEGLGKRSAQYDFHVSGIDVSTPSGALPLLSAATINGIRRCVASDLDSLPCGAPHLATTERQKAREKKGLTPDMKSVECKESELMRSRYCIRYELGMCPVHQGARPAGDLFLVNNGRRFALGFDCAACEMTLKAARK